MTVGIVGLGLIGGSIGLALREPGRTIVGYDSSPESVKVALSRFCIDSEGSLEEVAAADVVFVAVPPAYTVPTLEALREVKRAETVITDCTSVKAEVVEWAETTREPNFVVGHPMAGHQQSGAAFASAWMFRGAKWIICPLKRTSSSAVKSVEALVKAMGATPVRMDPSMHDRQVAMLSHLPHALAAALVLMKQRLGEGDVSGGSWKDLTRVGGVDPQLWTQIFMANRVEIANSLAHTEAALAGVRASLEANDRKAIESFFLQAQAAKKKEDL